MGFFGLADKAPPKTADRSKVRGVDLAELHKHGCKLCPLNDAVCKTPKMKPRGAKRPLVYILGDAPSEADDRNGRPFSDDAGRFIKQKIPNSFIDDVRFGYVVKTHPGTGDIKLGNNKDEKDKEWIYTKVPDNITIEACRTQVLEDIAANIDQLEAIITIGKVSLNWVAKETHAYLWQGRRIPVTIAGKMIWCYPFTHPYDVMKSRRWSSHVPDDESTWQRQFRQVFRDLDNEDHPQAPFVHTEKMARKNVECITGHDGSDDLRKIGNHLGIAADEKQAGMDYETSVLRPYNKNSLILTASIATKQKSLAWAVDHRQAGWTPKQRRKLEDMWREFLLEANCRKVAHQLAFEMEWSAVKYGSEVLRAGRWHDSISQAYILNQRQGLLGLESLTMQHFGIDIKKLSDVNRKDMANEPLDKILPYNGIDSKYHLLLSIRQLPILRERNLMAVYQHQLERIPTLVLTQMQGVPVDQEELAGFRTKYEKQQRKALARLKELPCWAQFRREFGQEFNPGSSQDASKMLVMLRLAKIVKGKKVAKSDAETLSRMDHPFPGALIKWRKPTKVLSTYCDPVTKGGEGSVVHDDGLLHPITSTYKVTTWRTSSEEPNSQNWPIRGPNKVIRRIVRKDKFKIVKFDYAGIQARNIAMESCDSSLIQSFIDWYDIHKEWTETFERQCKGYFPKNLHDDDEFKEQRGHVKNKFVFPSFFGAQPKSIMGQMNTMPHIRRPLKLEEVENVQDMLWDQFPEIKKWQNKLKKFYERHGWISGHSGFQCQAPISFNELINYPIQGDESIIVCSAMNALSQRDYKRYQPIMEIHDDLTFAWPESQVEKRGEVVIKEMLKHRFDWINVPLVVEMSVGDNWCDTERVGDFESVGTDDYREVKKHK